jgi:predicted Zn-dependent protease
MLILYEILDKEARQIAKTLGDVYNIPVELQKADLSTWFRPLPKFNGYWDSGKTIATKVNSTFPNTAVMILTNRDLYYGSHSADDEWIFGYCMGPIQVLSNARMKGKDSRPTQDLMISQSKYMKRFITMAVHELGHDVVSDKHMKKAYWVNAKDNKKYLLGEHCLDNKCVMYEVVDIITPLPSAGHLLIGKNKKFDAGLDEHITRIYDDWFCDDCKKSIVITPEYKNNVKN